MRQDGCLNWPIVSITEPQLLCHHAVFKTCLSIMSRFHLPSLLLLQPWSAWGLCIVPITNSLK